MCCVQHAVQVLVTAVTHKKGCCVQHTVQVHVTTVTHMRGGGATHATNKSYHTFVNSQSSLAETNKALFTGSIPCHATLCHAAPISK